MRCEAFLDYGSKNERICGNPNAKICDMCERWFCDEHAMIKDEPAKYHTHFVCWASRIFEMYPKKKDIPKTKIDNCPRCLKLYNRENKTELFNIDKLILKIYKDPSQASYRFVCGLCKSEMMDFVEHSNVKVVQNET